MTQDNLTTDQTSPRRIRGTRRITLGFAAILLAVAGCPAPEAPKNTTVAPPYRGQEVELIVPAAMQLTALWDVVLNEWTIKTGATIRWTEYSEKDPAAIAKALEAPAPTGGRVVLFPLRQLPELDRHLAPLDSATCPNLDSKDIFKGLRDRIVTRNRTLIAVPVTAPVLLCYYRSDLLQKAGLKPPETWEDYQKLIDALPTWAPGLSAVEPLSPEFRSTLFFARSVAFAKHPENYSVWFDLDSGAPLLDTAGFQEALTVAHRAWKSMPATIAQLSPAECRSQVLQGKAALAIGVEPVTRRKSGEMERAEGIEIGICRLPGSRRVYNPNSRHWDATGAIVHAPALCGFDGSALGIGKPATGSPDAAGNLLTVLAGEQFENNWASLPKSVCRESQVSFAASWHETGLMIEESSQGVDETAQSLRDVQLVADLPIEGAQEFRKAVELSLGKVVTGDMDPDTAIQAMQADFKEILSRRPANFIRSAYRKGLGLPVLESSAVVPPRVDSP